MPKKLDGIKEAKNIAKKYGGICLNTEYKNAAHSELWNKTKLQSMGIM